MGDAADDSDGFDWDLQSSTVRAGNKIPIPEGLRNQVVIDPSDSEEATWWGYDTETGYAFLANGYANSDRYVTVNNRSYKLEKSSRVTIPKPESEEVEVGVLGDRPDEGETAYFYSDSRLEQSDPRSVIVLSRAQFESVLSRQEVFSAIFGDMDNEDQRSGEFTLPKALREARDEEGDATVKFLREAFPVPE